MRNRWTKITAGGAAAFLIALALVSGSVYAVLQAVVWLEAPHLAWPWERVTSESATSALTNMAEVTVGVLGVAITVVSIIVELAATRYSPRITELFLRDRTNLTTLSFFVLTSVLVVWINVTLGPGEPPRTMALFELGLLSASLLALLPYFAFVFDFLSPTRVVRLIADNGVAAVRRVAAGGAVEANRRLLGVSLEQLGDIVHKAVQNQDRTIATAAIAALREVMVEAVDRKAELPDAWFDAYQDLKDDSDFVAFHRDVVRRLVPRRTWVEMKGLRQYQTTFGESILHARDVGHLVAIETRRLAVRAAEAGDAHALHLSLRYLNTFMRASINARDVRTAYNLLNEYRLLAQGLLGTSEQRAVLEVAGHIKGYGQLAFGAKLSFILETAAYDLCSLIEVVHAADAPEHDALLDVFLDVDREPGGDATQEASLRGVRKAQVKLALWYLARGEPERARRIHRDMQLEPKARLRSIRAELEGTVDEEFWEISDRGANFDWVDDERRSRIDEFFGWFEV